MPPSVRTYIPASFAPMIILSWGFAWFAISVLIFYLGCLLPTLRAKPPPLAPRSRSPKLCRHSLPQAVVPEPLHEPPEDDSSSSVKAAPTLQRAATVVVAPPSLPLKRPSTFKSILAFAPGRSTSSPQARPAQPERVSTSGLRRAATLSEALPPSRMPTMKTLSPVLRGGRATPSSKSSISLESETTLVDHLSPAEGVPAAFAAPRSVLPSIKMFRSFSRRMSFKQKADLASRASTSITHSMDDISEPQVADEHPEQAHPTVPGEVFTSKFVNPFRGKPKSADRSASSSPAPVPSSRRASVSRRMLASLHLGHTTDPRASPVPDSPRSSTSSVSTAYSTFSSSSVMSGSSSSSPRSNVSRTQPYGAPHYAPMPMPAPRGRASSRRATSLSLDRPATVAEESGEETGNALGLELGHGQTRNRADTVPAPQRKPFFRHRAMASESAVLAR
ncbi:hypothetical protein K466DRAFT_597411 [Polyporus arcularius HHB13444]|uniref:Uncharacterized protein n=1 Tax=Polyporus arcularius HHB13444 TaxID=1314778 RepID=A0A5C3PLT1_9APHY|nr:hypothetical protein K466DRAFT_597411 [Polyporus arcularius HHB13444]